MGAGFRNFMGSRYDFHRSFPEDDYAAYLDRLQDAGATDIEHAGRRLIHQKQKDRARRSIGLIHKKGMRAILYTGMFGAEDISAKDISRDWAQRGESGKILTWGRSARAAMMCPASEYISGVLVPELYEALQYGFDSIYFDIPWIMKGGCCCSNCESLREEGKNNDEIVRQGMEYIVRHLKDKFPQVSLGANAQAPGIYSHPHSGGHITNLEGLFDEYVTEWNPYRWGQKPHVVAESIRKAAETVQGKLYHATTCSYRGSVYSPERLGELFLAILSAGATPRLGVSFDSLDPIKEALMFAEGNLNLNCSSSAGNRKPLLLRQI